MDCSVTQPLSGWEFRLVFIPEAVAGVPEPIWDTSAVTLDHQSADFGPDERQPDRETADRTASRDAFTDERILDPYELTAWSCVMDNRPSGTVGTAPNAGHLYEAAMGTATNDPGVSEIYTIDGRNCKTLSGYYLGEGGEHGERVYGAIVQQMVLTLAQGASPTITFSGMANYRDRGNEVVLGEVLADEAGPSEILVAKEDYQYFDATKAVGWSYLVESEQIDATAIDRATDKMTFARAVNSTTKAEHAKDLVAALFVPTFVSVGTPISSTHVSVSRDGGTTDLTFMSGSVTHNTGLDYLEVEEGESRMTIILQKLLSTEFTFTFQSRDDTRQVFVEDFVTLADVDMAVEMGDGAGNLEVWDMPKCRITEVTEAIPTDQEGTVEFTVTGIALSPVASPYTGLSISFT